MKINNNKIDIGFLIIGLVMVLFPPWISVSYGYCGYALIFAGAGHTKSGMATPLGGGIPKYYESWVCSSAEVNYEVLIFQIAALAACWGIARLIQRSRA